MFKFFNKTISLLVLSFLIIISNFSVKASTDRVVSISVENHTTNEFLLEPVEYRIPEYLASLKVENAISYALRDNGLSAHIEMDFSTFDDYLDAITDKNGNKISNTNEKAWYIYSDNTYVEVFDWWDSVYVDHGSTIRLIYNDSNSYQDKNALIQKLASIDENQKLEIDTVYQKGLDILLNNGDYSSYLEELEDALNPKIKVESITILEENLNLNINQTHQLNIDVKPKNTTDKLSYSSSNENILKIDENGFITGFNEGKSLVTVSAHDISDTIEVQVNKVNADSIEFIDDKIQINVGEKYKLNPIIKPENTGDVVEYIIEDESILKLDNESIIALKEGQTTIYAKVNDLIAKLEVSVSGQIEVNEPTVIYRHNSGEISYLNQDDEIELSILDEGKFELLGTEDITFEDGHPYWDSSLKITEGLVSSTHYFILDDGTFMPFVEGTYTASVYDSQFTYNLIKDFKIKINKANIKGLKGYIDDNEIEHNSLYSLYGSEFKTIDIKALLADGTLKDLSPNVLNYKETTGDGYITHGKFGLYTNLEIKDLQGIYEIKTVDDSAEFSFKAISEKIDLDNFEVSLPQVYYIDQWNGLANQFIGINPNIKYSPSNVSNPNLNWINLNPDVAEYVPEHNNGIVPKRAGTAKFLVNSVDNPNISQEVSIELKYKNSLKHFDLNTKEYDIKQYEEIDLDFIFNPDNASEKRFDITVDKENIAEINQSVYLDKIYEDKKTKHTLYAKNKGTVSITLSPIDKTNDLQEITIKVNVLGNDITIDDTLIENALKVKKESSKQLLNTIHNTYGSEWNLFTLLQTKQSVKSKDIKEYLNSLSTVANLYPTDYARIILTLGALDVDASKYVDELVKYKKMDNLPSNHHIWTLIALDSKNYDYDNRDALINNILTYQKSDGSFSLSQDDSTGSIDLSAMALQALAPYEKSNKEVEHAIHRTLDYLSKEMTNKAGFKANGLENSNSTTQVLTALSILKIDVLKDERFIKGNHNIITNLLSYKTNDGFSFLDDNKTNEMASIQAVYALESYFRLLNNERNIFNLGEIKTSSYEIIEGKNQTVKDGDDLILKIDGNIEDFVALIIDGKVVNPKFYSIKSGSVIIRIYNSYLQNLKKRLNTEHTLEVIFKDGLVSTSFTLNQSKTNQTENSTKPNLNTNLNYEPILNTVQNNTYMLNVDDQKRFLNNEIEEYTNDQTNVKEVENIDGSTKDEVIKNMDDLKENDLQSSKNMNIFRFLFIGILVLNILYQLLTAKKD